MIQLYGIPNCDTVKKAKVWLDGQGLAYQFHDFKKEGVDRAALVFWLEALGKDKVLNKRGTTYRALLDADKARCETAEAAEVLAANPSLIKRPVAMYEGRVLIGFDVGEWQGKLAG